MEGKSISWNPRKSSEYHELYYSRLLLGESGSIEEGLKTLTDYLESKVIKK